MTSSVAKGKAQELTLVNELINEGYVPEWTGFGCKRSNIPAPVYSPEGFIASPKDEGIDIKVKVDGTDFVIQSKNWKRKLYPSIVREMDGVLTRQRKGTVGVIVAPNVNRFTRGTEETANTSIFKIILTDTRNFTNNLKEVAA
ncbi:14417_t:CDS:2, partial [Funneliformis geosporum]